MSAYAEPPAEDAAENQKQSTGTQPSTSLTCTGRRYWRASSTTPQASGACRAAPAGGRSHPSPPCSRSTSRTWGSQGGCALCTVLLPAACSRSSCGRRGGGGGVQAEDRSFLVDDGDSGGKVRAAGGCVMRTSPGFSGGACFSTDMFDHSLSVNGGLTDHCDHESGHPGAGGARLNRSPPRPCGATPGDRPAGAHPHRGPRTARRAGPARQAGRSPQLLLPRAAPDRAPRRAAGSPPSSGRPPYAPPPPPSHRDVAFTVG